MQSACAWLPRAAPAPSLRAMTTLLITDDACDGHVTPQGHPERVAHRHAVRDVLAGPAFAELIWAPAPPASDADLLLCHPQSYLDRLDASLPQTGTVALDPDTWLAPGSLAAARRAAGAGIAAVDAVLGGRAANAFCAMRPPGHHAEPDIAMGFCLFGNAAIAARHALDRHGFGRVAIVDFDVHHGNGTQAIVWDDPRILFASSHQMPLYPGTGDPAETGGHDNVINVALRAGDGGAALRRAWEGVILPRVAAFAPDLVVISAGFDAHRDDPLAGLAMVEADFAWITGAICDIAARHAAGRVVSVLEGGYDLDALAASVAAHVQVLMERGG
jgi:acetoin utilization deacetylase AcuC-like enzyme